MQIQTRENFLLFICVPGWLLFSPPLFAGDVELERPTYHSPLEVAFSPDGHTLAASDHTARSVVFLGVSTGKVSWEISMAGKPAGLSWSPDSRFLYAAEYESSAVAEIDTVKKSLRRISAPPWPFGLALAPKRGWLLVAGFAKDTVSVLGLPEGKEVFPFALPRMPYFLALDPQEKYVVAGNRLPAGDASDIKITSMVTLLDLETKQASPVPLPPNSINVHGVAISPEGKWAYVGHNIGRASLPTEQIEYGWINSNALTIIDLPAKKRYASILLDRPEEGAANPWGVAVSKDGAVLWISLSGTHQIGRLDLVKLHGFLEEELPRIARRVNSDNPGRSTARGSMGYSGAPNTPDRGGRNSGSVEVVTSDLPVEYGLGLYLGDVFTRSSLPGAGPRGLALSPDGKTLAAALYFEGTVALVDTRTDEVTKVFPLGRQPEADAIRQGEMIFHDGKRCFQNWLSCATCHPDGRSDGLNWDLLNDGIGNPKNTKSLLFSHRTPPAMSLGVRPGMEEAVVAGFKFLLFHDPGPEELQAVEAYLRSLEPAKSPYGNGGQLKEKALLGKAIFEDGTTRCSTCHPAPLYTDLKVHDVGTGMELDRGKPFDTPALIELWRTAPYLHHGRAKTLMEIFTRLNEKDRHGKTSHLSGEKLEALVEYLRSL